MQTKQWKVKESMIVWLSLSSASRVYQLHCLVMMVLTRSWTFLMFIPVFLVVETVLWVVEGRWGVWGGTQGCKVLDGGRKAGWVASVWSGKGLVWSGKGLAWVGKGLVCGGSVGWATFIAGWDIASMVLKLNTNSCIFWGGGKIIRRSVIWND